jgi:hypothetical protein
MTMGTKSRIALSLAVLLLLVAVQNAEAGDKWKHGIGTGFFALNLDGDLGLDTIAGPLKLDVDLDNGDVSDLVESAFGLSGYSSNGRWTILYAASTLELEGEGSGNIGAVPARADVTFTATRAAFSGVRHFGRGGNSTWGALFGVEFTKHEFENDLVIDGNPLRRELDNDWTDAVVGLTYAYAITENVSWNNRIQGGFGGSEGTFLINTGINWKVGQHWALTFYGQQNAVEYENESEGDPEWYLYDIDEFGVGFGFSYTF